MKDIVMRVTESEKEFIDRLRNYSVFELKDISSQLQNLLMITKLSGDYEKFKSSDELKELLLKLVNEREEITLRKIKSKKSSAVSQKPAKEQKHKKTPIQASSNQVSTGSYESTDTKESAELFNIALIEKLKARKFKNLLSGEQSIDAVNKKND
jgi:hypothetical protein